MFYTNVSDYETKEDMMNDFIALRMYDMAKDKEIERLHSIIKEVREYIEDKYAVILADDLFLDHDERIERKRLLEIIGILDKENNND